MKQEVKDRALVILFPGAIFHEISAAVEVLKDHMVIDFAMPSDERFELYPGLSIECSLKFADLCAQHYRVVLIPGGDFESVAENQTLDQFLLECLKQQTVTLAAICNGVCVLAKAGVLNGLRCTHTAHENWASPQQFPELLQFANRAFQNSHYVDENLVIDQQVITAKPWAALEFAVAIATQCELMEQAEAAKQLAYLRGLYPIKRVSG